MTPVLQAKNITKQFFQPAPVLLFNELNLELSPGSSTAIMGASGEGKSTLLQILGTLEPHCSGELWIQGQRVTPSHSPRLRNRSIGFVFQSYHLMEEYTVLDNVLMPAQIAGFATHAGSVPYKRAFELLERVHMQHRAKFLAKHLSGGEKQRVALARALCNDPMLILADEPSGNLDAENAQFVHQLLLDLVLKEGKTLLVVTHDPQLAHLCQRTLILKTGKLCEED